MTLYQEEEPFTVHAESIHYINTVINTVNTVTKSLLSTVWA